MNKLADLLEAKRLLDEPVENKKLGICTNYVIKANTLSVEYLLHEVLIQACEELGIYSGNECFPIASTNKALTYSLIYHGSNNLWSIFTRYGRRRRKVFKRMRKIIDRSIKEEQPW